MPIYKIIHKTLYTYKEMLEREEDGVISSDAVQKARDWLAEGATDFEWWECTIDTWKEALEQIGFTKPEIQFSGFYNQGDGASFTSGMDVEELLKFICSEITPDRWINPAQKSNKEDFRPWILHNIGQSGPGSYIGRLGRPPLGEKEARRVKRLIPLAADELSGQVHRLGGYGVHESTCHVSLDFSDTGYHRHVRLERLVNDLEDILEDLRRNISHAIFESLREEYEYRISDVALTEDAEANGYTFDRFGNRE